MFPENTVCSDNCKMNTSMIFESFLSFRIEVNSKQNPQNRKNITVEYLRVVQAGT